MDRQEVLAKIKQKAIEKIQEDKIIYTPDIEEDKKYRKFFAFKTVDLESEISEENIKDYSSMIAKTIKLFLSEQAITETIKFKIYGLESLHDRESFNDLVRGIFYYQPIKTNYDRLKSSNIVGVAKILSEEVSKLFLNAEITELAYKCLEQKIGGWLLQEVE